ncbi:MAG: class I SAM-dependent methyltransferase [Oscillospiraceae bacterium]|jgi:SAM-dependent methyltransferase|nr:class I SAM-dependent methyltransferase [Oscillospiraceae bacterium]
MTPAYSSLAAVYDRFTYDVDYAAFADFYEEAFARRGAAPKTLLDLGCGTGSLTALMASRGYELISADASPEMLSIAREKCSEINSEIAPLFLCQSMAQLDLYGTVDCALSSLDSLNYVPPEDLPEVFRRLNLFIEPGGLLIFDLLTPEHLRALDGSVSVDEDESALCLWRADFDEEENALFYGVDVFTKRGRFWQRESEEHIEYAHAPETILSLLTRAGFSEIEQRTDFQPDSGRLFIIARNTRA